MSDFLADQWPTLVWMLMTGVVAAVYWHQLKAMQKATSAQAFFAAVNLLQSDVQRELRGKLMALARNEPDHTKWSDLDKKEIVERVCQAYDTVGIMARDGMLRATLIVDSWENSLILCWGASSGYVQSLRATRGETFWDDFQWLAARAKERREAREAKKKG